MKKSNKIAKIATAAKVVKLVEVDDLSREAGLIVVTSCTKSNRTVSNKPARIIPAVAARIISRDIDGFSHRITYLCGIAGRLIRVAVVENYRGEMVISSCGEGGSAGLAKWSSVADFRAAKLAVEEALAEFSKLSATARQAAALTPAEIL